MFWKIEVLFGRYCFALNATYATHESAQQALEALPKRNGRTYRLASYRPGSWRNSHSRAHA